MPQGLTPRPQSLEGTRGRDGNRARGGSEKTFTVSVSAFTGLGWWPRYIVARVGCLHDQRVGQHQGALVESLISQVCRCPEVSAGVQRCAEVSRGGVQRCPQVQRCPEVCTGVQRRCAEEVSGGGVQQEVSRRRCPGGGVQEEVARRRWPGGGVQEEVARRRCPKRRCPRGGVQEEVSKRRCPRGGVQEEVSKRRCEEVSTGGIV